MSGWGHCVSEGVANGGELHHHQHQHLQYQQQQGCIHVVDFRLTELSLFAPCYTGQVGFGIGPSELSFVNFQLPLPNKFGALCVLPNEVIDVENILDELLSIYVFTREKSTGMKMSNRCEIALKPLSLSIENTKQEEVNSSSHQKVTLSTVDFDSSLYNSIGVGTLSGHVKGCVTLYRLTPRRVLPKPPKKSFVIPPLLLSNIASASESGSIEDDSLFEKQPPPPPPPPVKPELLVDDSADNTTPDDRPLPSRSPAKSPQLKHSLRYNLKVSEPNPLQHYIEVDSARMSQSTVDIVNKKHREEPEEEEDLSLIPWCLSMHYDDSHSLRVQGINPPVPVNASIHRRSLQRSKEKESLRDSRMSLLPDNDIITIVDPPRVPRVSHRYESKEGNAGPEDVRDNETLAAERRRRRSQPQRHLIRRSCDTDNKMMGRKLSGEERNSMHTNYFHNSPKVGNARSKPTIPGLAMPKFDCPDSIMTPMSNDESNNMIIQFDGNAISGQSISRHIRAQPGDSFKQQDDNRSNLEQKNINRYSVGVENYFGSVDGRRPILTGEDSAMMYFEN
jgi:hypothetical protein